MADYTVPVMMPPGTTGVAGTINLKEIYDSLVYRNVLPWFQGNPQADAAAQAGARAAFHYQLQSGNLGVDPNDPVVRDFLAQIPKGDLSNFTPAARADIERQETDFNSWLNMQDTGGESVASHNLDQNMSMSQLFGLAPTATALSTGFRLAPSDRTTTEIQPDNPRQMPPPDDGSSSPSPRRGFVIPSQPSDIGGFIPPDSLPQLVTVSSTSTNAPADSGGGSGGGGSSAGPSGGTGGTSSDSDTINRLMDLVAQQFAGGGGGSSGGVVALPTEVASQGSSGKGSIVPLLLIVAAVGGAIWYFRRKKKKEAAK